MKKRELMRLPLNREFEFTDGIFDYVMKVVKCEDGSKMQIWQRKGWVNERFIMFEEIEFDEENQYLNKYLKVHISVGGFSSSSEISYWQLDKLEMVNTNSFKNWLMKTKTSNTC